MLRVSVSQFCSSVTQLARERYKMTRYRLNNAIVLQLILEHMTDHNPLFHITTRHELQQAEASEATPPTYIPKGFEAEGFIHCSYRHQVVATANRIFKGQTDLVLLEIERSRLTCTVIDENLEGGSEHFPHIYGPLPLEAVTQMYEFPCDTNGLFQWPADGF